MVAVQHSDFQSVCLPQEFLKHAIPDYLVRGTDLFSLRLSNKKMTTANTTLTSVNGSKLYLFCQIGKKNFFGVPQDFSNSFICAMR